LTRKQNILHCFNRNSSSSTSSSSSSSSFIIRMTNVSSLINKIATNHREGTGTMLNNPAQFFIVNLRTLSNSTVQCEISKARIF
jgi:hypothetical protein